MGTWGPVRRDVDWDDDSGSDDRRTGLTLVRSDHDRVWKGVCAGVADAFGIPATVVRVGAIVLWALIGWPVIALYLLGRFTMPRAEPDPYLEPVRHNTCAWVIGAIVADMVIDGIGAMLDSSLALGIVALTVGAGLLSRRNDSD